MANAMKEKLRLPSKEVDRFLRKRRANRTDFLVGAIRSNSASLNISPRQF
jgi:hypothetical protein